MAKTLTIAIPDDLEQALTAQAECLNKSLEEVALQVLSQQLITPSPSISTPEVETDPLLRLIGSLSVDIADLAENHDRYIGQALARDLIENE